MTSSQLSAASAGCSLPTNAETTSATQAMRRRCDRRLKTAIFALVPFADTLSQALIIVALGGIAVTIRVRLVD
ncbi:hypothetical protein [uncultured Jannaschia sp.]|uniref:hypothetical protein n=1 Tax=uncultured Jannaschia sp. TaxID=293347 RepID=UPI002604E0B4|nr:hypothetical protein [uncultured Jannaschia sp.]